MFSNQSTEALLDVPCRAVGAVWGDKSDARFLVGSNSVQDEDSNHLHLLRYHSEVNELGIDASLPHPTGPVHRICCSPTDPALVVTASERSPEAALWKIPSDAIAQRDGVVPPYNDDDDGYGGDNSNNNGLGAATVQMEQLCALDGGGSDVVDVVWRDSSDGGDGIAALAGADILTVNRSGTVSQWDVSTAASTTTTEPVRRVDTSDPKRASPKNSSSLCCEARAAWDPHGQGNALAVTCGTSVRILDWRSTELAMSVPTGTVESFRAHRAHVTDLDYNPNKPYVLATSGQDGLLKFWDLRAARHPLLVARGGHSHWATTVNYNPFHDQLVLSSGTDSVVNLWRVSTISSAPLLALDGGPDAGGGVDADGIHNDNNNGSVGSETSAPNVRVGRYEHGDSVYGATWAASDAWIYLSLGYDGKVVLNHVPSKEKYKILL